MHFVNNSVLQTFCNMVSSDKLSITYFPLKKAPVQNGVKYHERVCSETVDTEKTSVASLSNSNSCHLELGLQKLKTMHEKVEE